jgi:argininosuccinate lyase
MVAFGCK